MHSVPVLEKMRSVTAVFSAAPGDNAVVIPVLPTVAIKEFDQFIFALLPIDPCFLFREPTRITDSFFIDMKGFVAAIGRVFEFDRRGWALIGHDAPFAEDDLLGQSEFCMNLLRHVDPPESIG